MFRGFRALLKIWIADLLLKSVVLVSEHPLSFPLPPKKEKENVLLLNEGSLGAGVAVLLARLIQLGILTC